MKPRSWALLVGIVLLTAAGCSDGDPILPTQDKDLFVVFKRVTLADDAPGRAEIEVEVRSGTSYAGSAPDGTRVSFKASLGQFVGGTDTTEAETHGGRATVTIILPEESRFGVTASVGSATAEIEFIIHDDGSVQLGTS